MAYSSPQNTVVDTEPLAFCVDIANTGGIMSQRGTFGYTSTLR